MQPSLEDHTVGVVALSLTVLGVRVRVVCGRGVDQVSLQFNCYILIALTFTALVLETLNTPELNPVRNHLQQNPHPN